MIKKFEEYLETKEQERWCDFHEIIHNSKTIRIIKGKRLCEDAYNYLLIRQSKLTFKALLDFYKDLPNSINSLTLRDDTNRNIKDKQGAVLTTHDYLYSKFRPPQMYLNWSVLGIYGGNYLILKSQENEQLLNRIKPISQYLDQLEGDKHAN